MKSTSGHRLLRELGRMQVSLRVPRPTRSASFGSVNESSPSPIVKVARNTLLQGHINVVFGLQCFSARFPII